MLKSVGVGPCMVKRLVLNLEADPGCGWSLMRFMSEFERLSRAMRSEFPQRNMIEAAARLHQTLKSYITLADRLFIATF